jgi:hypothetical protein
MNRRTEADAALEQRIARVLTGTAGFKAPEGLEARVLKVIEQRAAVPWWQRRVPEWPVLAQLLFALTGIAAAAGLLLARPATPKVLGTVISQPAALLQQPAADLHTTLNVLSVFHRLADTMIGALTDSVWYGGLALCAAAYVALFILLAFGYRLLQLPAAR